jgi:hypothetical protein
VKPVRALEAPAPAPHIEAAPAVPEPAEVTTWDRPPAVASRAVSEPDDAPAVETEVVELDAAESVELVDEADVALEEDEEEAAVDTDAPEITTQAIPEPAPPHALVEPAVAPVVPALQATPQEPVGQEVDAPTIPPAAGARKAAAVRMPVAAPLPANLERAPAEPPAPARADEALLAAPPAPAPPALAAAGPPAELQPIIIQPVRLSGVGVAEFIAETKAAAPQSFGESMAAALALTIE